MMRLSSVSGGTSPDSTPANLNFKSSPSAKFRGGGRRPMPAGPRPSPFTPWQGRQYKMYCSWPRRSWSTETVVGLSESTASFNGSLMSFISFQPHEATKKMQEAQAAIR